MHLIVLEFYLIHEQTKWIHVTTCAHITIARIVVCSLISYKDTFLSWGVHHTLPSQQYRFSSDVLLLYAFALYQYTIITWDSNTWYHCTRYYCTRYKGIIYQLYGCLLYNLVNSMESWIQVIIVITRIIHKLLAAGKFTSILVSQAKVGFW